MFSGRPKLLICCRSREIPLTPAPSRAPLPVPSPPWRRPPFPRKPSPSPGLPRPSQPGLPLKELSSGRGKLVETTCTPSLRVVNPASPFHFSHLVSGPARPSLIPFRCSSFSFSPVSQGLRRLVLAILAFLRASCFLGPYLPCGLFPLLPARRGLLSTSFRPPGQEAGNSWSPPGPGHTFPGAGPGTSSSGGQPPRKWW